MVRAEEKWNGKGPHQEVSKTQLLLNSIAGHFDPKVFVKCLLCQATTHKRTPNAMCLFSSALLYDLHHTGDYLYRCVRVGC